MKLTTLIAIVSETYPDGLVEEYYKDPNGNYGDGLARFIAKEIEETFDSEESDEVQLGEALRVMTNAREQVDEIIRKLDRLLYP